MDFKDPKYHCPRCKTSKILEYDEFIECPKCLLDFDKQLFGKLPDDEMVSRQEMGAIFDSFEELKDPKKAKRIFDSLLDDLNNEN
ncbi:MAG: hypothetical protein ACFFFB_09875 [Candidatus Heimdallarchaeota archaeon]